SAHAGSGSTCAIRLERISPSPACCCVIRRQRRQCRIARPRTITIDSDMGGDLAEHAVSNNVLLEVKNLKKHFPIKRGFIAARTVGYVKAVDDVSLVIREG